MPDWDLLGLHLDIVSSHGGVDEGRVEQEDAPGQDYPDHVNVRTSMTLGICFPFICYFITSHFSFKISNHHSNQFNFTFLEQKPLSLFFITQTLHKFNIKVYYKQTNISVLQYEGLRE